MLSEENYEYLCKIFMATALITSGVPYVPSGCMIAALLVSPRIVIMLVTLGILALQHLSPFTVFGLKYDIRKFTYLVPWYYVVVGGVIVYLVQPRLKGALVNKEQR